MDHSVDQQVFETQEPASFLPNHQVYENIFKWLADLILLTEAEQKEAGFFIENPHD